MATLKPVDATYWDDRLKEVETESLKGGPQPPDNGDMEARITKLEAIAEKTSERLAAIEKDVAVIKSNYATKADVEGAKTAVSEAKSSIIQWVVGAILVSQLLPAIPNFLRAFKLIP